MSRPLERLPKAHLHLHFTGSARVETIREMATKHRIRLPDSLLGGYPPQLSGGRDERGWFRFQRLYDAARHCVRDEEDMRRLIREAAIDDHAEGSRWLELQVDPTSYAPFVGGITPALEIILDEARSVSAAAERTGSAEVAIIVAASRIRHPLDARTLARLAARYAGDGPGQVIGFGLSNDERRGVTEEFAAAFAIAERAGLALVPHAGELLGPTAVEATLSAIGPDRLGHGVRAVEDPRVLDLVAGTGVALEVCPGSNIAMGVYERAEEVPLRRIMAAGVDIGLSADDPLLFDSRLLDQYWLARNELGFSDEELAELARGSIRASRMPPDRKSAAFADIERWLAL